jgi:hypothetical protein
MDEHQSDQSKLLRIIGNTLDAWSETNKKESGYNGIVIIGALSSALVAVCALYKVPIEDIARLMIEGAPFIDEDSDHDLH